MRQGNGLYCRPAATTEKTCELDPEPKLEHRQELNINQAIELRIKLTEEVECVNYVYSEATTDGVRTILDCHRKLCAQQLKRLNDIFERLTITI